MSRSRMKLNVVELSQAKDFKHEIRSRLGNTGINVLGTNVLVATYIAPEKTIGGIIRPNLNLDEDVYQGKIGLVVKLGENAFKFDGPYANKSTVLPKIGDYVMYHISDAREMSIRGVPCRVVDANLIRMIIDDPQDFY